MHASSPFANTYNGFVEAKDRFFEKKFDGISYLNCSRYESYKDGVSSLNQLDLYHNCRIDHY